MNIERNAALKAGWAETALAAHSSPTGDALSSANGPAADQQGGEITYIAAAPWRFDLFSAAIGGLITMGLFLLPIFIALSWRTPA